MSIKYFAFAFAIVGIFVAALVVASGDPATGRAQEAEAPSPMPQLYWVDAVAGKIQRTYRDDHTVVEDVVASGLVSPRSIALDGPPARCTGSGRSSAPAWTAPAPSPWSRVCMPRTSSRWTWRVARCTGRSTASTGYALPTSTAPNRENCPRRWVAPLGGGVHVAFTVPARRE